MVLPNGATAALSRRDSPEPGATRGKAPAGKSFIRVRSERCSPGATTVPLEELPLPQWHLGIAIGKKTGILCSLKPFLKQQLPFNWQRVVVKRKGGRCSQQGLPF